MTMSWDDAVKRIAAGEDVEAALDERSAAETALGLTDEQWQWAVKQEAERRRVARQTCKHSGYRGFSVDGRCCPDCGTFMADFGD